MQGATPHRVVAGLTAVAALSLFGSHALGAGFELPQRGVKEMGVAYGGSAALLEDATAVANNPAGLTRLEGHNISVGATLIQSEFEYDVDVERTLIDEVGGMVPGEGDGRITGESIAPHLYYSYEISPRVAFGFGIYAPFGSATEYDDDWAGRYHATETNITAININPAFAFQVTDTLSFGLGVVAQYLDAEFRNQIDVGYIVADELIQQVDETDASTAVEDIPILRDILGPLVDLITDVELANGAEGVVEDLAHEFDVFNDIEVDSWAYGFNAGLLWTPFERTRIGINYQSEVSHRAEGTASRPETLDQDFADALFDAISGVELIADLPVGSIPVGDIGDLQPEAAEDGLATALGPLGGGGGDVQSTFDFPETVTASFYQGITDWLAITGGATYTNWSNFEEVRFEYTDESLRGGEDLTGTGDDVRRRDLVVPFEWEDTWRYAGGLILNMGSITLRGGIAFDESPVPDAQRRTPRGPDNDRTIYAAGLSWAPTENFSVDAAYTLTRFDETEIENPENPAGTQHVIRGDYEGRLDSYALQINYRF